MLRGADGPPDRSGSTGPAPVLSGVMGRRTLAAGLASVLVLAIAAVCWLRSGRAASVELLADLPAGTWSDGAEVGDLRVVFAGGGRVGTDPNGEARLVLEPAPPLDPATTRAALVVSQDSYDFGCLQVSGRLRTDRQLRSGTPNPWEVAWLVWDYSDNGHFSYAMVKPNGWELGKRDPAYPGGQRFLATGDLAGAEWLEAWNTLAVRRTASSGVSRIVLSLNGRQVADFGDTERPYTGGAVGAYTEDARVSAAELAVQRCDH